MAKKTTKTPAKTAKKKPVTMAERVKHIERMVEDQCEFIVDTRMAVMERLDNIERLLATPQDVTGSPVDIKVTIPEQGLEPGDYTEASKEVADALTAMGYEWGDGDRTECAYIVWDDVYSMILNSTCQDENKLPQAEFLRRASVTAKKIGLVAKEERPWKPEVGEFMFRDNGDPCGMCIVLKSCDDGVHWVKWCRSGVDTWIDQRFCRKPLPEEVAKYHADQEAAKPIVPYVTRVMYGDEEYLAASSKPNTRGRYRLVPKNEGLIVCVMAERGQFTVIDP